MTEQIKDIKSALKKVKDQKENFGFMDRFTVDENWEVTKALEKQMPKKPILKERHSLIHVNKGDKPHEWISDSYMDWCCPVCDGGVGERYIPRTHDQQKLEYCPKCGQRIDWEGVKNDRAD